MVEKHRRALQKGVKESWEKVKNKVESLTPYSYKETRNLLLSNDYYRTLEGKAKNRTLQKEDSRLYKSIYIYTEELEETFRKQGSYKASYNFYKRVLFIAERNCKIDSLKCQCGKAYNWTQYCRYCPEPKKTMLGKSHSEEAKKKIRLSTLSYLEKLKGQLAPRYNKDSIQLIEDYGRKNGYKFMHAENGGEFYIKELGYFLDAYDPFNNVALEVDERHHFDKEGRLLERDTIRQKEIEEKLGCTFIRIKYDRV